MTLHGLRRHVLVSSVMLTLLMLAGDAGAQSNGARIFTTESHPASAGISPRVFTSDRFLLPVREATYKVQPPQPSRDSLKNGIVIGAIVGAAALGTFGALLCNALQEPGGPSCLGDTLRIAAVGAAIGAGAGVAVDAAFTRGAGVRVRLGFRF